MSNQQESPATPSFFTELYDVNNHAVQKPRVIGGGKITREQAAALGIVPTANASSEINEERRASHEYRK